MLTEWDYLNAINIAKADSYVNWGQLEFKNQNCDPERKCREENRIFAWSYW